MSLSPWYQVPVGRMHLCPICQGPRISLSDAQSLDPEHHLWMIEAWCPDCQREIGGEVSTFQLGALSDAAEEAFACMLGTVKRIDQGSENWLPPLITG